MPILQTPIKDLVIYEPKVFHDDRGYFFESYNKQSFERELGYSINFVQDNQARSVKNVLRGLHFQNHPQGQTKLIRVLEGTIWDVGKKKSVSVTPNSLQTNLAAFRFCKLWFPKINNLLFFKVVIPFFISCFGVE